MSEYIVERMVNQIYADPRTGNPVQGFVVFGVFPEFDEGFEVRVPNDNPDTVQAAIEDRLERRRMIAELGSDE